MTPSIPHWDSKASHYNKSTNLTHHTQKYWLAGLAAWDVRKA